MRPKLGIRNRRAPIWQDGRRKGEFDSLTVNARLMQKLFSATPLARSLSYVSTKRSTLKKQETFYFLSARIRAIVSRSQGVGALACK